MRTGTIRRAPVETAGCSDSAGRPRHPGWILAAAAVFVSCLREIFDESAYARFLSRVEKESSPETYAAFRREYEIGKVRRPRCC